MKKLLLIAAAAGTMAGAAMFSPPLRADDFPSRPITMTAVFGPASASDTICRIIADPLGAALKQPVVVEDRPGADGAVAALYVHHQPADGYNLLMGTNSPLSADPFLHKDINYDVMKDFVPISRVGSFTLMLVIDPKLPIHSVKELVDYAKANPGKLTYASGNTAGIVGMETLKRWAEISVLHVPYKSTPPALEDIIGGRVSMMFADFTTAMPHVAAGALRPLAVSRIKRSTLFPDLPTMDEAGIKGFNLDAWAGLVAPAGTPPDVVNKLNAALRPIIDSKEVQAKFKNVGFEGFSSTPQELGDFIKAQLAEWQKMIKDAGIQSD
jgi:tripartite-type tricarboxylate transporter receptor subunit TctC